ncbi:UNVERIFIED_CONTAM: hypothetical protein GTU68_023359 [Idotea baltica]|nr:hypothetical protein [Idotea baltica]
MVQLSKLAEAHGVDAKIIAKLEFFNPLASVKDRIGVSMVDAMEASGALKPGGTLIEPTSGNTGVGLAFVAAARGYKLILCMPESMSVERRKMLALMGAQLELTPKEKGMKGAIARAEELLAETPGAIIPQQFDNPANPAVHTRSTALEILEDTGGDFDALVAGVGTGGTITGCGQVFKEKGHAAQIIAVEPEDSPVISGGDPGFIPQNLDTALIDRTITIGNGTALETAREVARLEGLPVGISSGAALAAALELGAEDAMKGKTIVVIIPSFAERYLSTALFEGLG